MCLDFNMQTIEASTLFLVLHNCYNVVASVSLFLSLQHSQFTFHSDLCAIFNIQNSAHGQNCVRVKRRGTETERDTEQKRNWNQLKIKLEESVSRVCSYKNAEYLFCLFGPSYFLSSIYFDFDCDMNIWLLFHDEEHFSLMLATVVPHTIAFSSRLQLIIKIPWLVYHTIWFDVLVSFILRSHFFPHRFFLSLILFCSVVCFGCRHTLYVICVHSFCVTFNRCFFNSLYIMVFFSSSVLVVVYTLTKRTKTSSGGVLAVFFCVPRVWWLLKLINYQICTTAMHDNRTIFNRQKWTK